MGGGAATSAVRDAALAIRSSSAAEMTGKQIMPRWVGWTVVGTLGVSFGLVLLAAPLAAGQDDELPEGPAKKIVQSVCTQCHEIEMVTTQNFTKDQWSRNVDLMISRGAHLTPDQIPVVVAYLASNFGKPESGAGSTPAPGPISSRPASESTLSPPPLATSVPASATQAPSSLATTSAVGPETPPAAPAATSPAPAAAGNPDGGCTATPSSGSPKKKRKGFWGFLRKKKPSGCAGTEAATSENRGP